MFSDALSKTVYPGVRLKAEILGVTGEDCGGFTIGARCPYCLSLHSHHVHASTLSNLGAPEFRHHWAPCGYQERFIMGVPLDERFLAYQLSGFEDLDEDGDRSNVDEIDPYRARLSAGYAPEERVAAAVELIRAAPGLAGFDIERSALAPLTMLVRHSPDGSRHQIMTISVEQVPGSAMESQVVLQRHLMVDGQYRYSTAKDVHTHDDPHLVMLGVYLWLSVT